MDSRRADRRLRPGVIVAGLNPVTTDAVSMALMGFDPMADRGTPPFEVCDSIAEAGRGRRPGNARPEADRSDRHADPRSGFRFRGDPQKAESIAMPPNGNQRVVHGKQPTRFWQAGARRSPRDPSAEAVTHAVQPGIKLCAQGPAKPTDEFLQFLNQIGAEHISVASSPDLRTADGFQQIKKRYGDAGINVWNIGNTSVHNMPEVTLNLPGRDKKIEEYKQYLRNLGKTGIYYTTYAHMGNGIWSSGRSTLRGASGREFDMASPEKKGVWDGVEFKEPLSHGRVFSKEEIWENYTYFIKQVAPVAEEAGVRIGIHPDDPPVPVLAGVPRCIFSSFDGYRRALEIANSPNVGICLCCGTWLEGGKQLTGKDPEEMIRYFGAAENLEDPFPQRHRAPAAFCRDVHGQRLLRHVQDHESPARRELRRHRDPRPFARLWSAATSRRRRMVLRTCGHC